MLSVKDVSEKYGLTMTTAWRVLMTIEPDKKVRRGSKFRRYYDEERIEKILRERGYID